jgi:hypothetical protein
LPLRRQSTPSARRRLATCCLRRGSRPNPQVPVGQRPRQRLPSHLPLPQ